MRKVQNRFQKTENINDVNPLYLVHLCELKAFLSLSFSSSLSDSLWFSIFLFTSIIKRLFYFDLVMLPSSTVGHRFFFILFVCFLFEIAVNAPHNYVDKKSMQNCDGFFLHQSCFLFGCTSAFFLSLWYGISWL